ncbi:MAG TPA: ABC transporter substrate-binding protein [Synechococcales cyanobacterium M55_K2018_004]|nr:ABC transporter substrate-binding protein [Synechococcales cyanobacterium M55_K2018_004]
MAYLKRRSLLYALGGLAASTALASFDMTPREKRTFAMSTLEPSVQPAVDARTLEKPDLTIGFVPVNDCAPVAIAYEKGFFRKYGLNVTLSREASWGTARDGVIFGRLDASPVVSGAVTNARLGAEGARQAPLCAAMTIHRHGNAITMSRAMWEAGIRPLKEYNGDLEAFGRDFRRYFEGLPPEQRLWSVVLSSSIYEYFVRYLAAAVGVNPVTDFRITITPPPQMVTNMRIGAMQAYMVAEPWNTRAIAGNEGVGFTFAQGKEIWQGHPDRVLGVMEAFINENPRTYRSLVMAMIEACRYCSDPNNRAEVAQLITARSYTGAPLKLTQAALVGNYNYGGFDGQERLVRSPDTTLFFDLPATAEQVPGDHSTFLWQSQGLWLVTQAARWGQIPEFPVHAEALMRRAWRTDLYREIAAEMGIACPAEDYKVEAAAHFIDKRPFNPSDPVGYLNQFEIRANQPTKVWMS